jgi:hypothetical protein
VGGYIGMIPPEILLIYICVSASNLLDALNGKTKQKWSTYVSIGVGVGLSIVIGVIIGRVVKKQLDKIKSESNLAAIVRNSELASARRL